MLTTQEPLTVPDLKTASTPLLVQTALKLNRKHKANTAGLPVNLYRHLVHIHDELERRYPEVAPVMDRWAYSKAPLASYTETLVGAIPSSEKGYTQ